MEQGYKSTNPDTALNKRVAIIGAGAAGCICAYFLLKSGVDVTLYDKSSPLRTLLPTGGGRCNLAHAEYDFKELVKNYPRGEKFLLSAFSKFSTWDTLALFEELGIKTYTQDDNRIFPESNSAKEVREVILNKIRKAKIVKEKVIEVVKENGLFKVVTDNPTHLTSAPLAGEVAQCAVGGSQSQKLITTSPHLTFNKDKYCAQYPPHTTTFTHVIIATGGHSGYDILNNFDINIINPKPSLVGLNTKENFKELSGTVCKNVCAEGLQGDVLFTHFGLSGPLTYKISSIKAFDKFPYELELDLSPRLENFQEILNANPHKDIKNILKEFLPFKMVDVILKRLETLKTGPTSAPLAGTVPSEERTEKIVITNLKAHQINGKIRDLILEKIHHFKITITGTNRGEETVTAGGVDLNEINPKTMELKKVQNLYCIGEVLNIDGFCGGFNLQNAWSTAFIAAESVSK